MYIYLLYIRACESLHVFLHNPSPSALPELLAGIQQPPAAVGQVTLGESVGLCHILLYYSRCFIFITEASAHKGQIIVFDQGFPLCRGLIINRAIA